MFDDILGGADLNAMGALMAGATSHDATSLQGLSDRQARLCGRLRKFAFVEVVDKVSGLLTHAANQAPSQRIEALLHLAAIHCEGAQSPTLSQIREWLNDILLKDAIGLTEDPPEDVAISNTASQAGDIRLFTGMWEDPGGTLQDLLGSLIVLRSRPWAQTALDQTTELLRLAEAMADRAGAVRYQDAVISPVKAVVVTDRRMSAGRAAIAFPIQHVFELQLDPRLLAPFRFVQATGSAALRTQSLGHTDLERRPLLLEGGVLRVILPTAISAAARRHCLEAARAAGELADLAEALRGWQTQNLARTARHCGLTLAPGGGRVEDNLTVFEAEFDAGAQALIVLLSDDLDVAVDEGLKSMTPWPNGAAGRIAALEAEMWSRPATRRGMTLIVHGGVGLGYFAPLEDSPGDWVRTNVNLTDLAQLSWVPDFDATRVWKILHQEEAIAGQGLVIQNLGGFINLYGFLEGMEFNWTPESFGAANMIFLAGDYIAPLRGRLRQRLDAHLAMAPDRARWIEVQRQTTETFFEEIRDLPLFISTGDLSRGRLIGCARTTSRPWWVSVPNLPPGTPEAARQFVFRIWDAALNWLARLAPHLEQAFDLPEGPVDIRLAFPDLAEWTEDAALDAAGATRPIVTLDRTAVVLTSNLTALRAYARADNDAERWLIAAIAQGMADQAGVAVLPDWADNLASEITRSRRARFVHAIPSQNMHDMLLSALDYPRPRLIQDEDIAWARLRLARLSGWETSGAVPAADTPGLLQTAVLRLWERIRARLEGLDRDSVVRRALLSHDAIDKDRSEWRRTAAALLALYADVQEVLEVQAAREARRGMSGVASRALAEMAICVSPTEGGALCGQIDLDLLMADLGALLECANQCDAHYYDLAVSPLNVGANGAFMFDQGFVDAIQHPYLFAHQERVFRDGADAYAEAFEALAEPGASASAEVPDGFRTAMHAEYGMGVEDLVAFGVEIAEHALQAGSPLLALHKSKVLDWLRRGPERSRTQLVDAEAAYKSLTLRPRPRWDEQKPEGAKARDWQPWRTNRKLSLVRRPMVQLDTAEDPVVLVSPALLDRGVRRAFETVEGRLPAEAFDSRAMARWIGTAVDDKGHAFNHRVADRLRTLGWTARTDVNLTELGGTSEMGDADVLAWSATGEVWLIECKRLLIDRTVAEIGERLADYSHPGLRHGKRTPIQKHLDRLVFVNAQPADLARVVGVAAANLTIRSALVTDGLVPMQFEGRMSTLVDCVADYRGLDTAFGPPPQP